MAIKAKAEITISRIIDIENVVRYYLLQSSSIAAPSKPTANPPGGSWSTTEPTYNSGATNSLYFTDLTIMSNGTYSYSAVSKSSSYEAAKEAWNKANNAQNGVSHLTTRVESAETSISKNNEEIALRAKKTEVTEAINNIDIGGRNLVKSSNFSDMTKWIKMGTPAVREILTINGRRWAHIKATADGHFQGYHTPDLFDGRDEYIPLELNSEYTISFMAYATADNAVLQCYFHQRGDGDNGPAIEWLPVLKQTPHKYSYTFVSSSSQGDNRLVLMIGAYEGSDIYITDIKLEKGNKATDWTPAPEDYYTKTETDASIQVLSDKISQQVSTTDKLGTRLSKVEQDSGSWSVTLETANAAKKAADAANKTASSASSTASNAKLTADNANKTASSAVSTASNAQKTAENAVSTASSASTAATEAKNTASQANKTASTANSTASAAKKTADSANTTAGQAKSTADQANQTASSAKSAADKANENASSAVSTANTAKSTADTAKSTANTARQEASDAAKTATNFMGFDSNGLVVGDRTAETLGKNVLIGTDSVNIRNGSTVLAEFAEKLIAIGKGSPNAVIDFLNGLFQISTINDSGAHLSATKSLSIYADDAVDGTGDGSGHYSMITVGDTSMQLNTNNVGHIDIVNCNPTIGAIAQIISEVYGRNNENVSFIMETDKSTGRNIVGLDTGNGVYTKWKCNGSNTADITHYVKSSSGSTQIAQWDNGVRFLKNDNLMAFYDGTTPVLLSTAAYPNADTTLYLSSPVSQQPHGIVLEFAPYVNGSAVGYGFVTFFVPKSRNTGASVSFVMAGASFDIPCCKWIYIHDDKIIGNDVNYQSGTSNGVKYNNAAYVLTKVYGV